MTFGTPKELTTTTTDQDQGTFSFFIISRMERERESEKERRKKREASEKRQDAIGERKGNIKDILSHKQQPCLQYK